MPWPAIANLFGFTAAFPSLFFCGKQSTLLLFGLFCTYVVPRMLFTWPYLRQYGLVKAFVDAQEKNTATSNSWRGGVKKLVIYVFTWRGRQVYSLAALRLSEKSNFVIFFG